MGCGHPWMSRGGGIIWRLGEQWLSDCSYMGVGVEFGRVCVLGRSARSDCSRV